MLVLKGCAIVPFIADRIGANPVISILTRSSSSSFLFPTYLSTNLVTPNIALKLRLTLIVVPIWACSTKDAQPPASIFDRNGGTEPKGNEDSENFTDWVVYADAEDSYANTSPNIVLESSATTPRQESIHP